MHLKIVKVVTKKKIFFVIPFLKNSWWKTTPIYMCMIFHKKNFQWVTAPIPLFQTPQKFGLLRFIKGNKVQKENAVLILVLH